MASRSTLTSKTVVYGVAFFLERSISVLVLPIMTKNFSQEMYGVWTQIILTTALLTGIVLIGLHTATVKFMSGNMASKELSRLFHQMLIIVLANCLLALSIILGFKSGLSEIIFGKSIYVPIALHDGQSTNEVNKIKSSTNYWW